MSALSVILAPRGAAQLLYVLTAESGGPVTPVLEGLSGLTLRMETKESGWYDNTAGMPFTEPGERYWYRTGQMTAGGMLIASTRLCLREAVLPPDVLAALEDGIPAGTALPGMRRCLQQALPVYGIPGYEDLSVISSAALALGRQVAGSASERYTAEFAGHLAAVLSR